MKTDPKVVAQLQTSAANLALLAGQAQVDVQQLKVLGLGWLAKEVKCWYQASECHLRKVIKRILYYGVDPKYAVPEVQGTKTVTDLLNRNYAMVETILDQLIAARKIAWDSAADYTCDIYEHAVDDVEEIYYKIGRELALIKKLGEPGYIGARLEDE